ncbi:MAG: AAA family ATPase [bacterium]|nr:AAA family ATPase [bacterium]
MKILITGIPGTGKSTVAEQLSNKGVKTYDLDLADSICHWRSKKTGKLTDWYSGIGREWLDAHKWVCEKDKVKLLVNRAENFVVVGMPHNLDQLLLLFDKVILLQCSEKTFLQRLKTRDSNDFGKADSEQKYILSWYKDFERNMLAKNAIPIDTDRPLDVVVKNIITKLE